MTSHSVSEMRGILAMTLISLITNVISSIDYTCKQRLQAKNLPVEKNIPPANNKSFKRLRLKPAQVGAAAFGQAGRGSSLKHEVFDAHLLAIFAFAAFVAIFVHGVDIRLQAADFGVGIHPAMAAGDEGFLDIFDGADDIAALVFGQQGMTFALEQADVGVMAEANIEIAIGADLLGKPHVAGVEPIVAASDNNLLSSGRGGHGRRRRKAF